VNSEWNVTIYNASSTPYTLKIMTWVTAFFAPLTVVYQGWTYWVFPATDLQLSRSRRRSAWRGARPEPRRTPGSELPWTRDCGGHRPHYAATWLPPWAAGW